MSAICRRWLFIGRSAVFFETTYGLMQQSPSEIKEKLLRALDAEYNVLDMLTVVEIITVLEKTPITKDALETTRLGKYINELRRKTKNELLAKRAKDLVRRWRDMILPSNPGDVNLTLVNGKSQPTSPDPPVEAVPRTHAANKRLRKEDSPESKSEEPVTKVARLNGSSVRPMLTPEHGESSRDGFSSKSDNDLVPSIDDEPNTPSGPKKRGRKKGSKNQSTLAKAAAKSREELVEDKIVALARTPKVKTTQELLADLRSRSNEELPLVKLPQSIENKASLANCVLTKSEPYDDEEDDVDIIEIVKTKSVGKQECDTRSNNVVIEKERKSKKHNNTEAPSLKSLPPPEPSSVEEILSRLPPLNLDEIDWSEDSYSVPNSPQPVTEPDVERLHTEHCEGLNGNWETRDNHKTEFREWHEMITIQSSQDPTEPPLYALPYAVID